MNLRFGFGGACAHPFSLLTPPYPLPSYQTLHHLFRIVCKNWCPPPLPLPVLNISFFVSCHRVCLLRFVLSNWACAHSCPQIYFCLPFLTLHDSPLPILRKNTHCNTHYNIYLQHTLQHIFATHILYTLQLQPTLQHMTRCCLFVPFRFPLQ